MPHFGLNRVLLIGDVASEPRFKLTPERRIPRLWFRVRTDERYTDPTGAEGTRKAFHSVVVWGNHGQALSAFLREGHTVAIDGRLSSRTYQREGKTHYESEVIATSVVVLSPRDAQQSAA